METQKYTCPHCGCNEFVTQPNRYDIFIAENGKLLLQESPLIDVKIEIFCRECSEKLEYEEVDLIL